jgi:hypothetical protein
MNRYRWRFIQTSDGAEILVYDAKSANTLIALLKQTSKNEWEIREEVRGKKTLKNLEIPAAKARSSNEERRIHPRLTHKYRIILISGTQTFRTYSSDISMGGISLERMVPTAFQNRDNCVLMIGRTDRPENVEVHGRLICDAGSAKRVQFVAIDQPSSNTLEAWLKETNHKTA